MVFYRWSIPIASVLHYVHNLCVGACFISFVFMTVVSYEASKEEEGMKENSSEDHCNSWGFNVTANNCQRHSIKVSWNELSQQKTNLTVVFNSTFESFDRVISTKSTPYFETSVQPWTKYDVKFYINDTFLCEKPVFTPPSGPSECRDFFISVINDSMLYLSWKEPLKFNGPLSGYILEIELKKNNAIQPFEKDVGNVTSFLVRHESNHSIMDFSIYAYNKCHKFKLFGPIKEGNFTKEEQDLNSSIQPAASKQDTDYAESVTTPSTDLSRIFQEHTTSETSSSYNLSGTLLLLVLIFPLCYSF